LKRRFGPPLSKRSPVPGGMRVPIIGQQPPAPPKGLHRYHVSMAVERAGLPVSFSSFVIHGDRELSTAVQFAEVEDFGRQELIKHAQQEGLQLPEPKCTIIAFQHLMFIPQDVVDKLKREDVEEQGAAAPADEPTPALVEPAP
jgi:hypothetical protein